MAELSNRFGKWFEQFVAEVVGVRNLQGVVGRKAFGSGSAVVKVPPLVGEIDFLGMLPQTSTLVLLECKATSIGSQSRFVRNDVTKFITDPDSHVVKFRRKRDWVRANIEVLVKAIQSEPAVDRGAAFRPTTFASAIVTRYPVFLPSPPDDVPVVSVAELCDAMDRESSWPLKAGVEPL